MKASVGSSPTAQPSNSHVSVGRDCNMADSREPRLMASPGERSSEDRVAVMLTRDRRDGVR
jgi:hypothetical protein